MSGSMAQNDYKISLMQSYFCRNGLLLCNTNKELPSLEAEGGDWNSIVALIERGEVFYSKLYKGRVSYLSRELYYQIKPYKQRVKNLSAKSKEVYEFIKTTDLASTREIKNVLLISSADFTACLDELCKELFVTAIQRDKTINVNWSTFCWGTSNRWEQLKPHPKVKQDKERINLLLSAIMTEKQIQSLLK